MTCVAEIRFAPSESYPCPSLDGTVMEGGTETRTISSVITIFGAIERV